MSRLEASRVGVRFGTREAVAEVDFGLSSGELVGIIGPNGAGKSTLLRALAGLLRPDSGAVDLDGEPVRRMRDDERARRIGYLAQSAEVHWPVPVERVVALGRLPYLPPWRRPAPDDREAIDVAMGETGVDAFVGRPVTELSPPSLG
jgi:iron complex transport system ATP-binding protein